MSKGGCGTGAALRSEWTTRECSACGATTGILARRICGAADNQKYGATLTHISPGGLREESCTAWSSEEAAATTM